MLAGMFGALSGVTGKLSVSGDDVSLIMMAARVVLFLGNAVCTGQMWRYYLKALSLGPTPIAQVLNTGTNFAVSAICGILVFGEAVNWIWCVGAAAAAVGLALIATDSEVTT